MSRQRYESSEAPYKRLSATQQTHERIIRAGCVYIYGRIGQQGPETSQQITPQHEPHFLSSVCSRHVYSTTRGLFPYRGLLHGEFLAKVSHPDRFAISESVSDSLTSALWADYRCMFALCIDWSDKTACSSEKSSPKSFKPLLVCLQRVLVCSSAAIAGIATRYIT